MPESTSSIPAWKLLDQLRSNSALSSHEFTQALAALIFLRWADYQEAELEAIAAFDEIDYEPVLPVPLHWRTWHQLPPEKLRVFLLEGLPAALNQLNNSRHNPLATHLHHMASPVQKLANINTSSLNSLVHWLADQPFETPADRRQLLNVFDRTLLFSIKGQEGRIRQYLTPQGIAHLIALFATPKAGNRIYDPCFGSAGLLSAAFDVVLNDSTNKSVRTGTAELTFSGVEINQSAYIVGLTRLALAGINDPQLELGNSLERTPLSNPQQNGFDVVVANPPFGMRVNPEVADHFPIPTKDATGLFIQHALSQLKPGGRAVIVVPQGFLFRGGLEKKLRQYLLEQHTVETVVSLPPTAFLPFTSVKSSILVLRRGGTSKQIRMVDAERFFTQGPGRQPAVISENFSLELLENIRAIKPSEFCWDIDAEALTETEFDLTPRRRDQSGLISIIESLGPTVKIVQLKDCCREILSGKQPPPSNLVEIPSNDPWSDNTDKYLVRSSARSPQAELVPFEHAIPYIRIKDINKGQASKGSTWLTPDAASRIESQWKLLAGDVLISKSGTIGKVGIVRNDAVGAVAASGLFVLRTDGDRLDPHYLAAYLDSADCRAWLQDRASGGTINHLTKRIIEDLPVLLPPLQMQHQIAAMWREYEKDAIASLAQLITEGESNPIIDWVASELKNLPTDPESLSNPLDLGLLDQLSSRVKPLRNKAAHGMYGDNTLSPWIISFSEAVAPLRGVSDMPHGSALLSILQESARGLVVVKEAVKGQLPSFGKARKLTDIVSRWLTYASKALLNSVQLVFVIETSTLVVGKPQDIDVQVTNASPLPLRNIELAFEPAWGAGKIKYLAENASETLGLQAVPPDIAKAFTLLINWRAQTLDGSKVDGTREFVFEISPVSTDVESHTEDLGASPYVCGDPIRPERNDVFFGREELLDQIRRQIVQSGNVVLLEGNRRAGKSSILRHLEGVGPVPGWLGVYCSLQGAEGSQEGAGVPTPAVFREIAISIAKGMADLKIEVPLPDGSILPTGKKIGIAKACRSGISDEHSFADFRDYVEVALEALAEKRLCILLMLDEFDKLQEGIDNGVTSPQVPENIRFLVQTYPGISAILTGSRRLKRLREEYWSALFGLGTRFGVTSLSPEAAKRLVTEPVKGRLLYSREAGERAIILTNRQPFLLQSLCNRIFDMAARLKIRSISLDLVEEAATLLADDNEHFRSLWNYAETDCRRFILGLIHREAFGPDPLSFSLLREQLSAHGIEINDETLITDLDFLRELELVDMTGESGSGYYSLSIPLMGKWIGRQHDFEVLKNKARLETEEYHG
jgi:type I restriction enzyme M protein